MLKIQRYMLFAALGPFLAIAIGLTLLALLTQTLTQLDLLIERGQSPMTLIAISALATPQFMTVVAPIAIFSTVILVYSRLYTENEIVVGYAGGLNRWQISQPMIRLAAFVAFISLAINVFVQPFSYQLMRQKIFSIRSDLATTLVREAQFRQPAKGLTIYSRRIDPGGQMHGLMITDSTKGNPISYVAETGDVIKIQGTPAIVLKNGSIQRKKADNSIEIIGFNDYIVQLGKFNDKDATLLYKTPDRETYNLFHRDMTNYWDREHKGDLLAEAHRRFASPLNTIAAAFLGLWAILGGEFSRRGYGQRIFRASAALLTLLLLQTALTSAITKNPTLNFIQYILPIGTSLWVAFSLGMLRRFEIYSNAQFIEDEGAISAVR